ncbi:MAG: hypothetical protein ABI091_22820 [Ferruginibacter sp.]
MSYKYLYIDDTRDNLEQGMINALTDGNEIEITFHGPTEWETLIEWFKQEIPNHDGVILDLRLSDAPYKDGKYAQYKGSTVAQELRSLSKEGVLKDFPMILFSGTDKLEQYLDPTSKDLFDKIVDKTKIEQPGYFNYTDFRDKLKWLADGYAYINDLEERTIKEFFKTNDLTIFDPRFVEYFNTVLEKPVHIIVQFLIREVIGQPCFLINENYLSARLGISKLSEDWQNLLRKLSDCKYTGVFSNYYNHWWMPLINRYWKTEISEDLNLRTLSASKRTELIIDKSGLKKLNPLPRPEKCKSESFWVSCKSTEVAIDTIDGFVISGYDNKFPWQEPEYISIDEALKPTQHYKVLVTEKPRLDKLKILFEKNEQRVRK